MGVSKVSNLTIVIHQVEPVKSIQIQTKINLG